MLSIKFKVVTDWKTLTYNETRHEDTEEVLVASWRFKPYIPCRGWNVRAELWSYLDQWRGVTGFGDIQSMQKMLKQYQLFNSSPTLFRSQLRDDL